MSARTRNSSMKRVALVAGAAVTLAAGSALAAPSAFASGTLANGFTAKVVAHSGQTIRGAINATGYDVGVYIGPGVHNVRVLGARITGANDHGILVQDAYNDLIKGNTVLSNGLNRHAGLQEDKAIARVVGDVWLSNLVAWVTRRASATDVATRLELTVRLLLKK